MTMSKKANKGKNYYYNKYQKNRNSYRSLNRDNQKKNINDIEIVTEKVLPTREKRINDALLEGKTVAISNDSLKDAILNEKTIAINPELINDFALPKLKEEKKGFKHQKIIIGSVCILLIILGIISFLVFRNIERSYSLELI